MQVHFFRKFHRLKSIESYTGRFMIIRVIYICLQTYVEIESTQRCRAVYRIVKCTDITVCR